MVAAPKAALGAAVVADDDPDMRAYLARTLRGMGFADVFEAADGISAARLAHKPSVAIVVSDYIMPGLDGLALCDALKADDETSGIPFLLISGLVNEPPACTNGFLPKPFNAASLRASVASVLNLPG